MKITVPLSPYAPQYLEIDFENFIKIKVGTHGEIQSNYFLRSLWHTFDIQIRPDHCKDRCPWYFVPNRFAAKKYNVIILGNVETAIGALIVGISYKKKGDIDAIHFFSLKDGGQKHKNKLTEIVKEAINNCYSLTPYTIKARIKTNTIKDLGAMSYSTTNLTIWTENNEIRISYTIKAIDSFEANQLAKNRLYIFCNFLSVETNLFFEYDNFSLAEGNNLIKKENGEYIKDFIDLYPIKDNILYLSPYSISFLDKYIFVERDISTDKTLQTFLSSCSFINRGLSTELGLEVTANASFGTNILSLSPIDINDKQRIIDNSFIDYISAIETVTSANANTEECHECHSIKYKISSRVKDFMEKYHNEDMGRIFHSLYSYRSKLLHSGVSVTSNDDYKNRPLLDSRTGSGLVDYGLITIRINGFIKSFYILNIREWTTYALRCYYQEQFCERRTFDEIIEEESESVNQITKKMIQEIENSGNRSSGIVIEIPSIITIENKKK